MRLKTDRMLFISAQKNATTETPTKDDVFIYGTRSTILQVMRMPNGPLKILAEGLCRAKATHFEEHEDGFIQCHCMKTFQRPILILPLNLKQLGVKQSNCTQLFNIK